MHLKIIDNSTLNRKYNVQARQEFYTMVCTKKALQHSKFKMEYVVFVESWKVMGRQTTNLYISFLQTFAR